jgi:hypothetical protein
LLFIFIVTFEYYFVIKVVDIVRARQSLNISHLRNIAGAINRTSNTGAKNRRSPLSTTDNYSGRGSGRGRALTISLLSNSFRKLGDLQLGDTSGSRCSLNVCVGLLASPGSARAIAFNAASRSPRMAFDGSNRTAHLGAARLLMMAWRAILRVAFLAKWYCSTILGGDRSGGRALARRSFKLRDRRWLCFPGVLEDAAGAKYSAAARLKEQRRRDCRRHWGSLEAVLHCQRFPDLRCRGRPEMA